jgi:Flp pilus assembly protein TadG
MTMSKDPPVAALLDNSGATAVEFAIVAPAFVGLIIATLYLCMGLFLIGSLHFAVEDAARCASVNTATCSDSSSITSYAQSRYFGPSSSPIFTYASASCGNSVTGTVNYVANLYWRSVTIPISATACFP